MGFEMRLSYKIFSFILSLSLLLHIGGAHAGCGSSTNRGEENRGKKKVSKPVRVKDRGSSEQQEIPDSSSSSAKRKLRRKKKRRMKIAAENQQTSIVVHQDIELDEEQRRYGDLLGNKTTMQFSTVIRAE